MRFRNDINGLRALAVTVVVLFHYFPSLLPGGFVGVDIFFVISGYLMTSMIFMGLEENTFSITNFYMARFRRIVPALLAMVLVMGVVAYFIAPPKELLIYAKHAVGSVSFLSNIMYWTESGYFDLEAKSKWLLHTWSLSIEWQFYLLYPLVVTFVYRKFGLQSTKTVFLCIAALSFVLAVLISNYKPDAAFYLLPTRAWEMLVGSVAYFYTSSRSQRESKVLVLVALVAIFISCVYIDEIDAWPSILTLIPVLSTLLIIYLGLEKNMLFDNVVARRLGLYSYSIYLWHWPILILISKLESVNDLMLVLGVFVSVAAGALSYHCIESINYKAKFGRYLLLGSLGLLLLASVSAYFMDGLTFRMGEYRDWYSGINSITSHKVNGQKCHDRSFEKSCRTEQSLTTQNEVLLIGDSHAGVLAGTLFKYFETAETNFVSHTPSGCPLLSFVNKVDIVKGQHILSKRFTDYSNLVAQKIRDSEELVIVYSARLPMYLEGSLFNNGFGGVESGVIRYVVAPESSALTLTSVQKEMQSWLDLGHTLILIYPIPEVGWDVPSRFGHHVLVERSATFPQVKTSRSLYLERTAAAREVMDNVKGENLHRIYPSEIFCNDEYCFANDGKGFYYQDDNHLSIYGAELLIDRIDKKLFKYD
jgi:peptidoglycan/LPS O-acetylase OafA/YrhL